MVMPRAGAPEKLRGGSESHDVRWMPTYQRPNQQLETSPPLSNQSFAPTTQAENGSEEKRSRFFSNHFCLPIKVTVSAAT